MNEDSVNNLLDLLQIVPDKMTHEFLLGIDTSEEGAINHGAIAVLQEIARYAIESLSGGYREDGGPNDEWSQDRPFHTLSLNKWVADKSFAVLLPYFEDTDLLKSCIDAFIARESGWAMNIFDSNELLRFGQGQNVPAPDRLLQIDGSEHPIIVSATPTARLREMLEEKLGSPEQVEVRTSVGCRTLLGDPNLIKDLGLPVQPFEAFLNIPLRVHQWLSSDDPAFTLRTTLMQIRRDAHSRDLDAIWEESQETDSNVDILRKEGGGSLSGSFRPTNLTARQQRAFSVIRIRRLHSTAYFLLVPTDETDIMDTELFSNSRSVHRDGLCAVPIAPNEVRYVMRLLASPDDRPQLRRLDQERCQFNRIGPAHGEPCSASLEASMKGTTRVGGPIASRRCSCQWLKDSKDVFLYEVVE